MSLMMMGAGPAIPGGASPPPPPPAPIITWHEPTGSEITFQFRDESDDPVLCNVVMDYWSGDAEGWAYYDGPYEGVSQVSDVSAGNDLVRLIVTRVGGSEEAKVYVRFDGFAPPGGAVSYVGRLEPFYNAPEFSGHAAAYTIGYDTAPPASTAYYEARRESPPYLDDVSDGGVITEPSPWYRDGINPGLYKVSQYKSLDGEVSPPSPWSDEVEVTAAPEPPGEPSFIWEIGPIYNEVPEIIGWQIFGQVTDFSNAQEVVIRLYADVDGSQGSLLDQAVVFSGGDGLFEFGSEFIAEGFTGWISAQGWSESGGNGPETTPTQFGPLV